MASWYILGLCLLISACEPIANKTTTTLDTCTDWEFQSPEVVEPHLLLSSLNQVNQNQLNTDVRDLSTQFANRYYNSSLGQDAAMWLKNKWVTLTSQRDYAAATTYTHANFLQPSVIATLTGTIKPEEIIIIGGHLDSICHGINCEKNGSMQAPGANDNASGIAVITEVLRIWLMHLNQPERTIQFMAYAGEEVGLLGSKEIATDYRHQGHHVIAVLQLDMTSGGQTDNEIFFINDHVNEELTTYVTGLIDHYHDVLDITYDWVACHYPCSDHASWTQQEYASVFPIDHHFINDPITNIHSPNDTFDNLVSTSKMLKFTQLGLIFTQELSASNLDEPTDCN